MLTEDAFCFFEAPSNPCVGYPEVRIKYILALRVTLLMRSDILPEIVVEFGKTVEVKKHMDLYGATRVI